MADYNLGRVQGGGWFYSSAASSTSVNLSTITPTACKPLAGDVISFPNGDMRVVVSRTSTAVTCGEVIANFKGVEITSISSSGSGFVFTLSDGSSITVPVTTTQVTEVDAVESVNGKTGAVDIGSISTIFESNGTTVKKASYAGSAGTASSATTANGIANDTANSGGFAPFSSMKVAVKTIEVDPSSASQSELADFLNDGTVGSQSGLWFLYCQYCPTSGIQTWRMAPVSTRYERVLSTPATQYPLTIYTGQGKGIIWSGVESSAFTTFGGETLPKKIRLNWIKFHEA